MSDENPPKDLSQDVTAQTAAEEMKSDPRDLKRLRELLETEETFPHPFLHKFIGDNVPEFHEGVSQLQQRFPRLVRQSMRTSASQNHLSLSFTFLADNADEIIELLEATYEVPHIRIVL